MEKKQAEMFKVLGVASRIRIIDLLKQNGPLGVNRLSEKLGITPSAVSQHLKILKFAGLVTNERRGFSIPYDVDPEALEACRRFLSEICTCGCDGHCRVRDPESDGTGESLEQLKAYKHELEMEIERVQRRIDSLEDIK